MVVAVVVVSQLVGTEPDERCRFLGEDAGLGTSEAWQSIDKNPSQADIELTYRLMRDDAGSRRQHDRGWCFFEACVESFG